VLLLRKLLSVDIVRFVGSTVQTNDLELASESVRRIFRVLEKISSSVRAHDLPRYPSSYESTNLLTRSFLPATYAPGKLDWTRPGERRHPVVFSAAPVTFFSEIA
jgi:hypothetical protein